MRFVPCATTFGGRLSWRYLRGATGVRTLATCVLLILAISIAAKLSASSGGEGGDPDEYTAEITAFSPEDPLNDAVVGGPHAGQDERGRAYTLEGGAPLVEANLPLVVLEALADLQLASPFDIDYRFGQRVAALYDLTGDGMIELRIKSFALDQANSEFALTHIFSSSDGSWLFTTAATDDFDPWADILGDATGDGAVTQADLDLVLANLGLTGENLTAFDGDLNGDGVVDALDVAIVLDNLGNTLFGQITFDGEGNVTGVQSDDGTDLPMYFESNPGELCCCPCYSPDGVWCPGCGPNLDPCDLDPCGAGCSSACSPSCEGQGGGPCGPNCPTAACNPLCAGNNWSCNPECDGSDPCAAECEDHGGGPCGANCDSAGCNPDCDGSDPCAPECEGDGGGPCGANCDSAGCNPDCDGSDPCHPDCEDEGGGPCGENCDESKCNPLCGLDPGGQPYGPCHSQCPDRECNPACGVDDNGVPYGPCHPECEDEEAKKCECLPIEPPDPNEPEKPDFVCVGTTRSFSHGGCPSECEEDCEPSGFSWSVSDGGTIIDGHGTNTVTILFTDVEKVTISVTNGCCRKTQELIVIDAHLISVEYGNGNHPVARDTTGAPYETPHWKIEPISQGDVCAIEPACCGGDWDDRCESLRWSQAVPDEHPVAYTRQLDPAVEAYITVEQLRFRLRMPDDYLPATVVVDIWAPNGLHQPAMLVQQGGHLYGVNNLDIAYRGTTIAAFDPYLVQWDLYVDGVQISCGNTSAFGSYESENQMYVTLNDPATSPLYHTVVDIACRAAAGLSSNYQNRVLHAIWWRFQDGGIKRAEPDEQTGDDVKLHYYLNWQTTNINVAGLLQNTSYDGGATVVGDAQCYAWADLFIECLRAHGLPYDIANNRYVFVANIPAPFLDRLFLVNKWWFWSPTGNNPAFPYVNIADFSGTGAIIDDNTYRWVGWVDVDDETGVGGQNQPNPASLFHNHAVVNIGGMLFDPSYGRHYSWGLQQLNAEAIAGHGYKLDPDFTTLTLELHFRQNPAGAGDLAHWSNFPNTPPILVVP